MIYRFLNKNDETFEVKNPHQHDYVYLPLADAKGQLLSAITPYLSGDIKRDNDSFLTCPQSVEDLKNNFLGRRDFIIRAKGRVIRLSEPADEDTLQAGFLYQKLIKKYRKLIDVEVTNFIPHDFPVEVMRITVKNAAGRPVTLQGFSMLYVYARSAENVRDHRHVSSLLQRVRSDQYGLLYKPTMIFNEKGHRSNTTEYFVYGCLHQGKKKYLPQRKISDFNYLVSGKRSITDAEGLTERVLNTEKDVITQGMENAAVLVFPKTALKKGEEATFIMMMGIEGDAKAPVIKKAPSYLLSPSKIDAVFHETAEYWKKLSQRITFSLGNPVVENWLTWVSIQPMLRKLFGCSFLPHFDYGKGGRGWRDLWQDALSLSLTEPESTRTMIVNNFNGVRIDGSNATIITRDGRFISDRNNVSRVWMDHGVWPFLTTKLYINQTGDWRILFEEAGYYRDHQLKRSREIDTFDGAQTPSFREGKQAPLSINPEQVPPKAGRVERVDRAFGGDTVLKDAQGNGYKGTILEHILVQHLVQFFNVGEHNNIRLENADWNDGLDRASSRGESAAFSCMYAWNLKELTFLLERLNSDTLYFFEELKLLLDSLSAPVQYDNPGEKQKRLNEYFEATKKSVKGSRAALKRGEVIADLRKKAEWMYEHIRKQEWIADPGMFNGYYDDHAERVEGRRGNNVRMTLTGQVFPLMSGIAATEHAEKVFRAVKRFLYDAKKKGFRLNTDFKGLQPLFGRAFSFVYGDKENGAFFSHMNVMFSNALYKQELAHHGSFVLQGIMNMASAEQAGMYPNLPEYFDAEGRGKYCYLTGSASWFMFTLLQETFGIKGDYGDLLVEPKLTLDEFGKADRVSAGFYFAGKRITIIYRNRKRADYPDYSIRSLCLNGKFLSQDDYLTVHHRCLKIPRNTLTSLCTREENALEIELG